MAARDTQRCFCGFDDLFKPCDISVVHYICSYYLDRLVAIRLFRLSGTRGLAATVVPVVYTFNGANVMRYRTLYVGNLLASATPTSLQDHFAEYGGTNARIVPRHGFGFVDVLEDFAAAAINEMNQSLYQGHRLTVVEAEEAAVGVRPRSPSINLIAEETMGDSVGTHRAS